MASSWKRMIYHTRKIQRSNNSLAPPLLKPKWSTIESLAKRRSLVVKKKSPICATCFLRPSYKGKNVLIRDEDWLLMWNTLREEAGCPTSCSCWIESTPGIPWDLIVAELTRDITLAQISGKFSVADRAPLCGTEFLLFNGICFDNARDHEITSYKFIFFSEE